MKKYRSGLTTSDNIISNQIMYKINNNVPTINTNIFDRNNFKQN